ncbi:hypothetical protein ACOSQ3_017465 [Xanthoceras sorbifolium]
MRNSSGDVLLAGFDVIKGVLPPDITEAKAIFFGFYLAQQIGVLVGVLKSDALSVISLLNKKGSPLSAIGLVLDDIFDILNGFSNVVNFVHVPRGANRATHSLA